MEAKLDSWVMACMPGGAKNDGVIGYFRVCLASFTKHHDWLESTIKIQNTI